MEGIKKERKKWSLVDSKEAKTMQDLYDSGTPLMDIAKLMGRSPSTVSSHVTVLSRNDRIATFGTEESKGNTEKLKPYSSFADYKGNDAVTSAYVRNVKHRIWPGYKVKLYTYQGDERYEPGPDEYKTVKILETYKHVVVTSAGDMTWNEIATGLFNKEKRERDDKSIC